MSIDPDHLAFAERIRLDRSVPGPAFIESVEEAIDWIDLSLPAASRRWFRATRENSMVLSTAGTLRSWRWCVTTSSTR